MITLKLTNNNELFIDVQKKNNVLLNIFAVVINNTIYTFFFCFLNIPFLFLLFSAYLIDQKNIAVY